MLRLTLMAIRYAFFDEERTGVLTKPTIDDILTKTWDCRNPFTSGHCPICKKDQISGMVPLREHFWD